MMVTLAIFSMVVLAVVSVNVFGLRMIELTEPKMLAEAEARKMFNTFLQDVRAANRVEVFNGGVSTNQGNVLELKLWFRNPPQTNHVRYELDVPTAELFRTEVRVVNGVAEPEEFELLASGIINSPVFTLEDQSENLLALQSSRKVVGMSLEFSHLYPTEYPVGEDQRFKPYMHQTKVAFQIR